MKQIHFFSVTTTPHVHPHNMSGPTHSLFIDKVPSKRTRLIHAQNTFKKNTWHPNKKNRNSSLGSPQAQVSVVPINLKQRPIKTKLKQHVHFTHNTFTKDISTAEQRKARRNQTLSLHKKLNHKKNTHPRKTIPQLQITARSPKNKKTKHLI